MSHIYILQNLYDLSDMKVMMEVIDSRAFSEFCGVASPRQIPDGDTIGRFRAILTENEIQKRLFSKGTIVDSTIIKAPTSTKNREKARDPEAHSTKKGNTWYFGYKAHIGVDSKTGLVHTVKATSANVHDVTKVPELLTGEEEFVYGDSGYLGADKREDAVIKNNNGKKLNTKSTGDLHRSRSFPKVGNTKRKNQNTKNHLYARKSNTYSE